MDKFVIQKFMEGGLVDALIIEKDQSLLNDYDLDSVSKDFDRGCVFVRRQYDPSNGYFIKDGRWDYGPVEVALGYIKSNYGKDKKVEGHPSEIYEG